jgi:hypothetical protein
MVTFSALCSWLSLAAVCMALFYTYYLFAVWMTVTYSLQSVRTTGLASSP